MSQADPTAYLDDTVRIRRLSRSAIESVRQAVSLNREIGVEHTVTFGATYVETTRYGAEQICAKLEGLAEAASDGWEANSGDPLAEQRARTREAAIRRLAKKFFDAGTLLWRHADSEARYNGQWVEYTGPTGQHRILAGDMERAVAHWLGFISRARA